MMQIKLPFRSADILIPKENHEVFSTIACDQFTSEPDYWSKVEAITMGNPSAYHITLPEIYLKDDNEKRITTINRTMKKYLDSDFFKEYKDALIYIERTISTGKIRRGLIGVIDLEAYDYTPGTKKPIRATEGTVPERIPPRVQIRKDAPLEMPHVMLLIDDPSQTVIEPLTSRCYETVYDFELMTGAGHLRGKLIPKDDQKQIFTALEALCEKTASPLLFAVGDGNHSLATALECYRKNPTEENRYALVEVVNIHDTALEFEPIYRVLFGVDPADVTAAARRYFEELPKKDCSSRMSVISASCETTIPSPSFPVEQLQSFIEKYIATHPGASVDYIHGVDSTKTLCNQPNAVGFIFDGMQKKDLFPYIKERGVLPRKSFSMGEALDKRFYMECRRIK